MRSHEPLFGETSIRRLVPLTLATAMLSTACASHRAISGGTKPQPVRLVDSEATGENPPRITLPLERDSVRFAVIGDCGTGGFHQYEVGREMVGAHKEFPFDFVIMLGDNIYGGKSSRDFERKFELPYKPLLDSGVTFYASLGNHDSVNERYYKPFHMSGQRYYTFKKGNARFFALDSNYMDLQQLKWLESQLRGSSDRWKVCFFHHPLYSDGRSHGPDLDLRARLEPLLDRYGVNVVFAGHDHVYERMKPQNGLTYFVVGNSGELRRHNLRPSSLMAAGFDNDRAFMIVEISESSFHFEAVSRLGKMIDSGVLHPQSAVYIHGGRTSKGPAGSAEGR